MPVAAAICINEKRELLMVLQGKPEEEKTWSIPGGRSEGDESFEACCIREVREETGYEVAVGPLISTKADGQIRYFEAWVIGGAPTTQLDPDGLIYEVAWKSIDELMGLKLTYEEDKETLVRWLREERSA